MRKLSLLLAASALFGSLSVQAAPATAGGLIGTVSGAVAGVPVLGAPLAGVLDTVGAQISGLPVLGDLLGGEIPGVGGLPLPGLDGLPVLGDLLGGGALPGLDGGLPVVGDLLAGGLPL